MGPEVSPEMIEIKFQQILFWVSFPSPGCSGLKEFLDDVEQQGCSSSISVELYAFGGLSDKPLSLKGKWAGAKYLGEIYRMMIPRMADRELIKLTKTVGKSFCQRLAIVSICFLIDSMTSIDKVYLRFCVLIYAVFVAQVCSLARTEMLINAQLGVSIINWVVSCITGLD